MIKLKDLIKIEAIIFVGIQATGKSTFYMKKFFKTHIRINLDMLKTRNREKILINACIEAKQKFVIDNTNPVVEDRRKYIEILKKAKYKIICYYFSSNLSESINRNDLRIGKEKIPLVGLKSTYSKLEKPNYKEGFDEIIYVKIENNNFVVKEWKNEV
jgi:predicted kinase